MTGYIMRQKTNLKVHANLLAVLVTGCAGNPLAPDVSQSHPGNPHAESSPLPPLETGLLTFTNSVAAPAAESQAGQAHEHDHKK
ncbi:MAG TPA: hypothetical protein VMF06_13840 [Candidatus Limnocylindria bacterium]|nr:hypothetical protein [Candidatus Limnocylindria bacterium]